MEPERVVVFLDWQNVYKSARKLFHSDRGPVQLGNVHPMRLGERLAEGRPGHARELTQVRIYRGQPGSTRDPQSYSANRRQQAAWERAGAKVIQRTLRYPPGWPYHKAQEKCIDVALAVVALGGNQHPHCEVAAWADPDRRSSRLSIPRVRLWCHHLDLDDYKAMADVRDYTVG